LYRLHYTLVRAGVLFVEKYTIDGVGVRCDCCLVVFLEVLRKATEGLRIVGGPVGIEPGILNSTLQVTCSVVVRVLFPD